VFFSVYEALKQNLPMHGTLAPLNHMLSASIGEIVCVIFSYLRVSTFRVCLGGMFSSGAH
jgi:hypothetical protein